MEPLFNYFLIMAVLFWLYFRLKRFLEGDTIGNSLLTIILIPLTVAATWYPAFFLPTWVGLPDWTLVIFVPAGLWAFYRLFVYCVPPKTKDLER